MDNENKTNHSSSTPNMMTIRPKEVADKNLMKLSGSRIKNGPCIIVFTSTHRDKKKNIVVCS